MCDLEAIGAPSIFKTIRSAAALALSCVVVAAGVEPLFSLFSVGVGVGVGVGVRIYVYIYIHIGATCNCSKRWTIYIYIYIYI